MTTALQTQVQLRNLLPFRQAWRESAAIAILALAAYYAFPDYLSLLNRIAILSILVLSLDLVVGYAGLATLGHVAFFGVGAYAAANMAIWLTANPFLGLLAGSAAGGLAAGLSGLFILRYQGFAFLMLTVAVAQIFQSMGGKLTWFTGGDDGLSGFTTAPIFGFSFDMQGRVAYVYSAAGLLLCYWLARRVVSSPFGLSVLGINQCRARMNALGTAVVPQLWKMYVLAGAIAGFAGALSAQTNGIVGLDSLSFDLSAEILVMLILGGAGRLYGAILGTSAFLVLHHTASSIDPYNWLFVIGAMLMLVVLFPRNTLSRLPAVLLSKFSVRRPSASAPN
jgi:branched-chain amino acid transport system permease protein